MLYSKYFVQVDGSQYIQHCWLFYLFSWREVKKIQSEKKKVNDLILFFACAVQFVLLEVADDTKFIESLVKY